ncbi:MAG: PAS domain S-box protein [Candidatus Eisenbacteria bacterium]|nr:PAS domain S-box protein [Candidatus Eisenbacteria bacterium]
MTQQRMPSRVRVRVDLIANLLRPEGGCGRAAPRVDAQSRLQPQGYRRCLGCANWFSGRRMRCFARGRRRLRQPRGARGCNLSRNQDLERAADRWSKRPGSSPPAAPGAGGRMESERSTLEPGAWQTATRNRNRLLSRLRFADRVHKLSLGFALVYLLAATGLTIYLSASTGALPQRLQTELPILLLHACAAGALAGLGYYACRRVRRQRAERSELRTRLEDSQERFQSLPHITILLTHEGRIRDYNRAAESFFGHRRAKVLGEEFVSLFIPQVYHDTFGQQLSAAGEGRDTEPFETILPGRDGTGRLISWDCAAVAAPRGAGDGIAVAGRDITEERSAIEALQEATRRQRDVFESMSGAAAIYEAQAGGREFVLREFNPACERLEGLVRNRAIGRRLTELRPQARKDGFLELLQRVWRTEEPERLLARAGEEGDAAQWREHYASKLSSGEVVAVSYDLSEQQQQLEELRRIAWLLDGDTPDDADAAPSRTLDAASCGARGEVARALRPADLQEIVEESLRLLGTSLAIFERDGAYVIPRQTRGWCRHLDEASRHLCRTDDDEEARACEAWLCHRSCWDGAARQAIVTGQSVDVPCTGGRNLHAVPIRAGHEIVGALCLGYGDPPRDESALAEIAERYQTDVEALVKQADAYAARPPAMVTAAQQSLQAAAERIGAVVQARRHLHAWRASERRLQDIIGCVGEWVWETDERGTLTYSSESVREILGYEPTEVVGKTPFQLMPPEQGRQASIAFHEALQRRRPIRDLETIKINKQGGPAHLVTRAVPLLDEEGRVRGYRGVDRDVTAMRRTEEALSKSDEEYRLVVDNAREGIAIVQGQTVLFVNEAFLGICDRGRDEIMTTPFPKLIDPEDRPGVMRYFADVMLGEQQAPTCEHRLVPRDGAVRWVETYGVTINWEGEPALLCFLTDITDQKVAEEAARENEERYERVSDSLPVAVYAQLPGDGMGRIFLAGCAEELTGHVTQAFLEDPELFANILHPDDRQRVLSEIAEHRRSAETLDTQYRIISQTGQVRWVRDTSHPHLDAEGALLEFNGVLQDITSWKETEERLRDRERELGMIREHVPTLVAYIDGDERHHSANDAYCETFGRTRSEVIGSRLADVVGQQTYGALGKLVREGLDGERVEVDVQLEGENEATRWLEVTCEPDRRGREVRGIFLFAVDATARHRAEESLRDAQARYRLLADHQTDLVIQLDGEGRIAWASESCCELLGRSEAELAASDFLSEIDPRDRGAASEALVKLCHDPRVSSFEVRLGSPEESRWFAWTAKGVLDDQKQLTEMIAVGRDVTEQKQIELRLQQADAAIREELQTAHEEKQRLAQQLEEAQRRSRDTREQLEQQLKQSQHQAQETRQRLEARLREAQRSEEENRQRLEAQLQEAQKLERTTREQLETDLKAAIERGRESQQRLEAELREAQERARGTEEKLHAQLEQAQQLDQETRTQLQRELAEAQQSERKAREQLDTQLAQAQALQREAREALEAQMRRAQEIEARGEVPEPATDEAAHTTQDGEAGATIGPAQAQVTPPAARKTAVPGAGGKPSPRRQSSDPKQPEWASDGAEPPEETRRPSASPKATEAEAAERAGAPEAAEDARPTGTASPPQRPGQRGEERTTEDATPRDAKAATRPDAEAAIRQDVGAGASPDARARSSQDAAAAVPRDARGVASQGTRTPRPSETTDAGASRGPSQRKKSVPVSSRGQGERVLIVADRPNDLMLATQALWKNGYRVMSVGSTEKAVEYCRRHEETYDLIVCDLNAPSPEAVRRIAELSKQRSQLAVLICASANAQQQRWSQPGAGSLEFLAKPYGTQELLRRVTEILGAAQGKRPGKQVEDAANHGDSHAA